MKTHFIARTQSLYGFATRLCLALAALSSSALATSQEPAPRPTQVPKWDMVRFELKSWGSNLYSWQFTPKYGGVHTENVEPDDPQTQEHLIEYRSLEANLGRFQKLQAILSELPDPAPDSAQCQKFMPDLAYGTIRLTRGATTTEITWNSGCEDSDYAPFLRVLRDADALVRHWVKDVPITRTETQRR